MIELEEMVNQCHGEVFMNKNKIVELFTEFSLIILSHLYWDPNMENIHFSLAHMIT